jgi:hypothetical protein
MMEPMMQQGSSEQNPSNTKGLPQIGPGDALMMPELALGNHAFRHTVDSALACLAAMGISPARIHLRRTGREASPEGIIIAQSPPAGRKIELDTHIHLQIAGLGFTHALPAGMWDSGGEAEPGTREMLAGIDDPLEKLAHWAHEGAGFFRLSEADHQACERWMALFGVRTSGWPRELWFPLASLLAQLPWLACSEEGIGLALGVLFHVPVASLRYVQSMAAIAGDKTSLLGRRASRLGVDVVLGDAIEDLAYLRIVLGPVSLETYEAFAEGEQGRLLLCAFDYLLPAFQDFEIEWAVEDARRCPQLGIRERNSRLGINTHMGSAA